MSAATATEATQLRAFMGRQLTMTCSLNTRQVTGTNRGGDAEYGAWGAQTGVPCLLYQETGPGETLTPERETVQRSWVLLVSRTQAVTDKDTVSHVVDVTGLVVTEGPHNILDIAPELSHLALALEGVSGG